MTNRTTLRRGIYTLAAAATLGLALAGPASARPEPGEPVVSSSSRPPIIKTVEVPVDNDDFEPVQVGGGVLAGLALAGAGAALASRRRHEMPHFA